MIKFSKIDINELILISIFEKIDVNKIILFIKISPY